MTALKAADLRRLRTFEDVLDWFADKLDWPVDASDLEELTYPWDPAELGLPQHQVPHLKTLRQLRPLETGQPWGIFFIEFDGPRLPLTVLRRLLDKMVTRKRAMGDGSKHTWQLDDLLFIVITSGDDAIELHLLAFFDHPGHSPEIRSLPWRPRQSPDRHLKRLASELLPLLAWPDDPEDLEAWRKTWRSAFRLRHGEAIATAAALAERMADVAKKLRSEIERAIAKEHGTGPFSELLEQVKKQLVGDVDPPRFADMCAQTLVYGVLASRITDPLAFGASPALTAIPLANPFLSGFFDQVHGGASTLDLESIGLDQLVDDLRESNVEAILDQFGSRIHGADPVIHFYEEFLKRYDRKMRADAGAFYTPQPVVEFMTRAVDQILRARFGLERGIADEATWAEVAASNKFDVPAGVDGAVPFITMVDPATGTGTFLVEWLRRARDCFLETGAKAEWPEHLRRFVLPSMHAFELMLGPYAIAHLKVALALQDVDTLAMPTILLTDTLEMQPAEIALDDDAPEVLAREGERAADVKNHTPFTVCIGNPPYDREQRDGKDSGGKRKGGVARFGATGTAPLMNKVLEPLSAAGLGRHAKNAYNDYVYFWTWAMWQTVTRRQTPGLVALITASSYLDGVSLGGLRSHLRDVFDELWVVDLGGEGRGARFDENIFEIRTPVAIAVGVRTGSPTKECKMRYLAVTGTREEKFSKLAKLDLLAADQQELFFTGLQGLTPRSNSDYQQWPEITDLFPVVFPGVKAGRTWVIGPSESVLERRLAELISTSARGRRQLFKDSPTGRKADAPLGRTNMPGRWDHASVAKMKSQPSRQAYGYRSFDRQYVIADPRFLDRASSGWGVNGPSQLFLTTLTSTKLGLGPAVTATPYVPDLHHFRGSYGAKDVIPIHRDRRGRQPNVTTGLLGVLSETLGRVLSADDLVSYVYGLTATAAFGERFTAELGEGAGPVRIPLTSDVRVFEKVAALGRDLLWWHTWGDRFGNDAEDLPAGTAVQIVPVNGYPEDFHYDSATGTLRVGSGTVGPIPEDVWAFEVSGLKVIHSWLGNRMKKGKGRKSSPLDDIRPERWTLTSELLTLLAVLEHTVAVTPKARQLLNAVVSSELIPATALPIPSEAELKPPKAD